MSSRRGAIPMVDLAALLACVPACVLALAACGPEPYAECTPEAAEPGVRLVCPMAGEVDRPFTLHVPEEWDGESALPLLVMLHGGGGNRTGMERLTCGDGSATDPGCLQNVAQRQGLAVVLPDGHPQRPARNVRTWNAGGRSPAWGCVSGAACRERVDDVGYLDAVVAHLQEIIPIAEDGVHVAGFSNGAAMAFRWACEGSSAVDTVVAVGGMNQHGVAQGECRGRPRVLQVHGFDDPCWRWAASTDACLGSDRPRKAGVEESMTFWREQLECGAVPRTDPERHPEQEDDGDGHEDASEGAGGRSADREDGSRGTEDAGRGSEGEMRPRAEGPSSGGGGDSPEDTAEPEAWLPDAALAESREESGTVRDQARAATWYRFHGCERDLFLLALERGGHAWPDGHQFLGAEQIGRVFRGLGFNARMVAFLLASDGDWP